MGWLERATGSHRPRPRVVLVAADRPGAPSIRDAVAEALAGRAPITPEAAEVHADVVLVDAGVGGDPLACTVPAVGEVAAAVDRGRQLAARAKAEGITVLVGRGMNPAPPALDELDDGPLGTLRRDGDGETAVLTGLALGAGEQGLAYLHDGPAATAAARVAVAIAPALATRLNAGGIETLRQFSA